MLERAKHNNYLVLIDPTPRSAVSIIGFIDWIEPSCGFNAGTKNTADRILLKSTTLNSVVSLYIEFPLAKNKHLWGFISDDLFKEHIEAKRKIVSFKKISFPQRKNYPRTVYELDRFPFSQFISIQSNHSHQDIPDFESLFHLG